MMNGAEPGKRGGGGMSEQRRNRVRLEISREACRLFWQQGVERTSGDQIADAVGLSTRTIWRHFRSKESCAEPLVLKGLAWEISTLRSWPLELSLEDHLLAERDRYGREAGGSEVADNALAMKMIRLADSEPALRTAWLMACDQLEREMADIIAKRLRLPADNMDVRLHAATASAILRVVSEDIGARIQDGTDPKHFADSPAYLANAIRRATGGSLGDPVVS